MQKRLIDVERSLIVACDMDGDPSYGGLARSLSDVKGVIAYKMGMMSLFHGLGGQIRYIRGVRAKCDDTKIILDYQKGGTDIPDMGPKFAKQVKAERCDAVILFPLAGPETQTRWTKCCQDEGLHVIVGGLMSHDRFLESEGGYISDNAPERIFEQACAEGVRDFVLPMTPRRIGYTKKLIAHLNEELGPDNYTSYPLGFGAQGGNLKQSLPLLGRHVHPIIGRDIYEEPEDQRSSVAEKFLSVLQQ